LELFVYRETLKQKAHRLKSLCGNWA